MKGLRVYFLIMALAGILFSSISGKAAEGIFAKEAKSEQYYRELEKQYVEQVKQYLDSTGYENSGVMLTKVIYDKETREYTLSVYNKQLEALSETEFMELKRALQNLEFTEKGCSFFHFFPAQDS